jgi:hypothetical protein
MTVLGASQPAAEATSASAAPESVAFFDRGGYVREHARQRS